MDKKLSLLFSKCKCGFFMSVNDHKNSHQTIEDKLDDLRCGENEIKNISNDVFEKILETDTLIELQFYPDTPIGFYVIYHYDLELALEQALRCFE